MKVSIIELNPETASQLLKQNHNNRKVKDNKVKKYVKMMKDGRWVENGESIVVDDNGNLTNGQHRCHAVKIANYSYKAVLVEGIDSGNKTISTLDTGATRTGSDVFSIAGQSSSARKNNISKTILTHELGYAKTVDSTTLSHQEVLEFYEKNQEYLDELMVHVNTIYQKLEGVYVISYSQIALYMHVLSGGFFSENLITFFNQICGLESINGSLTNYVHRKLLMHKINKTSVHYKWLNMAIIKCWNKFITGKNLNESKMTITIDANPPKVRYEYPLYKKGLKLL